MRRALLSASLALAIAGPVPAAIDPAARALAIQAKVRGVPVPANDLVCTLGDSLTFINWANDPSTATPTIQQGRGYAFWAQYLSGARVRFPQAYNFGVSGETSTQIAARVASPLNAPCAAVVMGMGTNDFPSNGTLPTYATTIANIRTTAAALRAAGKIVYVLTIPPRGLAAATVWTQSQANGVSLVNTYIRRQIGLDVPGVVVIDAWDDLADPASIVNVYKDGIVATADPTHWLAPGAYQVGRRIAADIVGRWPARDLLPHSNADVYDATNNPTGCLNANPMLTGTGGTISGTTPTPSGAWADSWVASGSDSGLTLAGAKATSAATGRAMQQLMIGGTNSGASSTVQFYQNINIAKVAAGDVIEAFAYLEQDAGSAGVGGAALDLRTSDAVNGQADANAGYKANGIGVYWPGVAHSGLLRTPPLTVTQPLTAFSIRLSVYSAAGTGVAIGDTVRVSNICVRKVIAGF